MNKLTTALLLSASLFAGAAVAVPQDGIYSGTTSQGFVIEFTVSGGGTLVSSLNATSDYTCSFGNQVVGIGYAPNQAINGNNFFIQTGYTAGFGINPGTDFVTLMRGTFEGTFASGTLTQLRSVYRGSGQLTESCRANGTTWTAMLVGPADAGTDRREGTTISVQPVRAK